MISIKNSSKEIDDIYKKLKEAFAEQKYFPRGTILVKPNLSGRQPITEGENTTTYFLDALLKILLDNKCKVVIGHSSLLGTKDRSYPFEKIIKDSGFDKYKKMKNITLMNFDIANRNKKEINGFKFEIPKIVNEADSYINLAKLKTHMEATVTLSLKNQMGLLPENNRIGMHKTNLEKLIADLSTVARPEISIVEGIVGMEGNGPHHGKDKEVGKLFVGSDMVELDSVISYLIGLNPKNIAHLNEAEKLGTGRIPLINELNKYKKDRFVFKKANFTQKVGKKLLVWPTTSCSRCITALNEAGKELKRTPKGIISLIKAGYLGKETHIVIGKGNNVKIPKNAKLICVGICAKDFADKHNVDCLLKCPPDVSETVDYLLDKF